MTGRWIFLFGSIQVRPARNLAVVLPWGECQITFWVGTLLKALALEGR